ncbi:MAG: PilZ domain-containing protein [Neisseriaceae bacterium]|nr:PilZ domain-containing protein [Neisseriaceae bacterium]
MAEAPKKQVKMVNIAIHDRTMLYSSYMSFVRTGGLFIVSQDHFEMGDEVMLILEVMSNENKFPLKTKVVWKNPAGHNPMRPQGIGLMFPKDDVGKQAKDVIEKNLAGLLDNPRVTYTM